MAKKNLIDEVKKNLNIGYLIQSLIFVAAIGAPLLLGAILSYTNVQGYTIFLIVVGLSIAAMYFVRGWLYTAFKLKEKKKKKKEMKYVSEKDQVSETA